jgi:hypothetical protein
MRLGLFLPQALLFSNPLTCAGEFPVASAIEASSVAKVGD